MRNNSDIFVKVNYKVKGIGNELRCDARINYIYAFEASKYAIGGGFCNRNACSLVFKAQDFTEAKKIIEANPILKRWLARYKNIKYDITVIPAFEALN